MTKSSALGTRAIGVRAATNVFHGVRYAASRSRPLNYAVTINWDRLEIADEDASTKFRDLRRRVRRSWTHLRQNHRLALGSLDDVAAHENPDGHRNTHWLVHVPDGFRRDFRRIVTKFFKKVVGVSDLGRSLHFQAVDAAGSFAKYILKGTQDEFADYFHMETMDQGFVEGRGRTFVSRSLGFTARKNANWQRKPGKV